MAYYIGLVFYQLKVALSYKSGSLAFYSIIFSAITTGLETINNLEFLGVSYTFLLLAVGLIMADFFTGAIASRYEHIQEGKKAGGWFESGKISYTIYKFLSILLLLWISIEIELAVEDAVVRSNKGFMSPIYQSTINTIKLLRTAVFTLICGREYVSIGENLKRRFGKQFYAFSLFERIFDVLEKRVIKKIENTDVCK